MQFTLWGMDGRATSSSRGQGKCGLPTEIGIAREALLFSQLQCTPPRVRRFTSTPGRTTGTTPLAAEGKEKGFLVKRWLVITARVDFLSKKIELLDVKVEDNEP